MLVGPRCSAARRLDQLEHIVHTRELMWRHSRRTTVDDVARQEAEIDRDACLTRPENGIHQLVRILIRTYVASKLSKCNGSRIEILLPTDPRARRAAAGGCRHRPVP